MTLMMEHNMSTWDDSAPWLSSKGGDEYSLDALSAAPGYDDLLDRAFSAGTAVGNVVDSQTRPSADTCSSRPGTPLPWDSAPDETPDLLSLTLGNCRSDSFAGRASSSLYDNAIVVKNSFFLSAPNSFVSQQQQQPSHMSLMVDREVCNLNNGQDDGAEALNTFPLSSMAGTSNTSIQEEGHESRKTKTWNQVSYLRKQPTEANSTSMLPSIMGDGVGQNHGVLFQQQFADSNSASMYTSNVKLSDPHTKESSSQPNGHQDIYRANKSWQQCGNDNIVPLETLSLPNHHYQQEPQGFSKKDISNWICQVFGTNSASNSENSTLFVPNSSQANFSSYSAAVEISSPNRGSNTTNGAPFMNCASTSYDELKKRSHKKRPALSIESIAQGPTSLLHKHGLAEQMQQPSSKYSIDLPFQSPTSIRSAGKAAQLPSQKEDCVARQKSVGNAARAPRKKRKKLFLKNSPPIDAKAQAAAAQQAAAMADTPNASAAVLAADMLRGVTIRPSGKWQAQYYYAGKSRYIGVFDNREKAALAYEVARGMLQGNLNSIRMQDKETTNARVVLARKAALAAVSELVRSKQNLPDKI